MNRDGTLLGEHIAVKRFRECHGSQQTAVGQCRLGLEVASLLGLEVASLLGLEVANG